MIRFLRENWVNDGAEGESVHRLCNELELAWEDLDRYKNAVADQLHYDMKAILSDTPEHRVRVALQNLTEACRGLPTDLTGQEWDRLNAALAAAKGVLP